MLVKRTNRLISAAALVMSLCLMVTALSPIVIAADAEDRVYYSDLFYGYSNEYLLSDYLNTYAIETNTVMWDLYNDYMNGSGTFWTVIASSLGVAASPEQLFIYFSDHFVGTEITYNHVLDAANQEFLFKMMDSGLPETAEQTAGFHRLTSVCGKAGSLIEELDADFELAGLVSDTEKVRGFLQFCGMNGHLSSITATQLNDLEGFLEGHIGEFLSDTADMVDVMTAIYLTLVLEDVRMSMLDAIVKNADPNSTLYKGMSRLRAQVQNSFVEYFVKNYLTNKLLEGAIDLVTKGFGPYKLATGLLGIAKLVIFDWVLDIPDIDDLLKQTVLTEYARDLYLVTVNEIAVFYKPFEPNEVLAYEELVAALIAATKAGLEATKPLALDSNEDRLNSIIAEYEHVTYDSYIKNLLKILRSIDRQERKVKTYTEPWQIPENTIFDEASDELQPNCIYMFEGVAWGDYIAANPTTLRTDSGCPLVIEGKLTIQRCTVSAPAGQKITMGQLNVRAGGVLQNEAELNCSELIVTPDYNASSIVHNFNELNISGDLTLEHDEDNYTFGWLYGKLCQSKASARITIGGDVYAGTAACFSITDGLLLLNGDDVQRVTNLVAYDLIFDNPDGIEYGSDIAVTGEFAPVFAAFGNNSPLICNGYYVKLLPGATVAERSGTFGNICLSGGVLSVSCTVDTLRIAQTTALSGVTVTTDDVIVDDVFTVSADAELAVNSELLIREGKTVTNNGIIRCEDLTVDAGSLYDTDFHNNGQLFISDDMTLMYDSSYPADYGYLHQAEETAAVYVGGDVIAGNTGCFDITAGLFELCGTKQQELTNLQVCNLTISNPAGVRYLTDIVITGRFSPNGNPLEYGDYQAVLKAGASLSGGTGTHGKIFINGTVSLGSGTVDELYVRRNASVAAGEELIVLGDLTVAVDGVFINEGVVRCKNLFLRAINNSGSDFYNRGQLYVTEDTTLERDGSYPANTGYLYQETESAQLFLGDDLFTSSTLCWKVTAGTVQSTQVDRTIALINAIGTATLDKALAIAEARAAYDALNPILRAYITNYGLLTAAETALAALEESAAAMVFTAAEEVKDGDYRVSAYVKSAKGELPALVVMICTYDENQKFQSCVLLPVGTVEEGRTVSVETTVSQGMQWKAMIVTPSALRPLAACCGSEP